MTGSLTSRLYTIPQHCLLFTSSCPIPFSPTPPLPTLSCSSAARDLARNPTAQATFQSVRQGSSQLNGGIGSGRGKRNRLGHSCRRRGELRQVGSWMNLQLGRSAALEKSSSGSRSRSSESSGSRILSLLSSPQPLGKRTIAREGKLLTSRSGFFPHLYSRL